MRHEGLFAWQSFSSVVTGVSPDLTRCSVPSAWRPISTSIIGAPFPAVLAVIAFFFSLIPLVGTLTGAAIIVLTCLIPGLGSPTIALWAAIYYLVYMQLEAYFISPRIMNRAVSIPGAVVVVAALSGGALLGLLVAGRLLVAVCSVLRFTIGAGRLLGLLGLVLGLVLRLLILGLLDLGLLLLGLLLHDLLLDLLVNSLRIVLDGSLVLRAGEGLGLGLLNSNRRRLLDLLLGSRLLLDLLLGLLGRLGHGGLLLFLDHVAEDVVQHKVTVSLRGENEGLSELSVGLRLVGDLADDLDDDVDVGCLGVDVGDADLAVLELELLYPVVDCLGGTC